MRTADDLTVIISGKVKLEIDKKAGDRWLRTDKIPLRDDQGEVSGILVVATDVTELKAALEQAGDGRPWSRALAY